MPALCCSSWLERSNGANGGQELPASVDVFVVLEKHRLAPLALRRGGAFQDRGPGYDVPAARFLTVDGRL